MASINSLPLEVINMIIRRIATSVDEANFENQLALTARISSSWTTFSEERLHSNLKFHNQDQARAWLESGKAGEFKTRVLELKGDIDSETSNEVMERMNGLNELWFYLDKDHSFDMNILLDERFSELYYLTIQSPTTYEPSDSTPFPFALSSLHFDLGSIFSPELLTALLLNSRYIIDTLHMMYNHDEGLKSLLHLEECTELITLSIRPEHTDPTALPSLSKLVSFHTVCYYIEPDIETFELLLMALPPSQLKYFSLGIYCVDDVDVEELEWIEKLLKFPGFNVLETFCVYYSGPEAEKMVDLVIEWKKRGIVASFKHWASL